jgi:DNA-binding response OmpR family regulator
MSKKVLIIDDNPRVIEILTEFLSRHGYDTCSASDGAEGFEAVHKEEPDLIILDLQLRDEWGARFFRMFTEVEAFKQIPLIVKSGREDTYIPLERAVAAFLKPFNLLELLDVINKTIGR